MAETWNENIFPLPTVTFNVDVNHQNIRSRMDSGRVRQRPRFSREIRVATAMFELNRLQYSAWKYFWDNKLNRGTDWFNMRLPLPDTNELTETEIRFVSDYKEQHRHGGNWDITTTIEVKEAPTISDNFFQLFEIEGLDLTNWFSVVSNLHDEIEHWEDEHSFNNF